MGIMPVGVKLSINFRMSVLRILEFTLIARQCSVVVYELHDQFGERAAAGPAHFLLSVESIAEHETHGTERKGDVRREFPVGAGHAAGQGFRHVSLARVLRKSSAAQGVELLRLFLVGFCGCS